MQKEGIRAQRGYNTPRGYYGGKTDIVADNALNREFNVEHPNQWWVTDITYIKHMKAFFFWQSSWTYPLCQPSCPVGSFA
jgi:putative transposase